MPPLPHLARLSLILLTGLGQLTSCNPAPQPPAETQPAPVTLPPNVKELPPAQAAAWLEAHPTAIILDLRMPEERTREGKLPGSISLDYLQPAAHPTLDRLDSKRPLFIYCALGGRSRLAAAGLLQPPGFPEICILKGGLEAWLAEDRPTQK